MVVLESSLKCSAANEKKVSPLSTKGGDTFAVIAGSAVSTRNASVHPRGVAR